MLANLNTNHNLAKLGHVVSGKVRDFLYNAGQNMPLTDAQSKSLKAVDSRGRKADGGGLFGEGVLYRRSHEI